MDTPQRSREAAHDSLRWVISAGLPAPVGSWWPPDSTIQALPSDALYDGGPGVLLAMAQAALDGVEQPAQGAVERLAALCRTPGRSQPGLYTGLAGQATALTVWGQVTGDATALEAASAGLHRLTEAWGEESGWIPVDDIIMGDAGVVAALLAYGDDEVKGWLPPALAQLAAAGQDAEGGKDWPIQGMCMPGFSHGTAGVGYVLARAVEVTGDNAVLAAAVSAGERMVALGDRGDGTWLAPHSVPQQEWAAPHSFGWCHGPTGSLRLFAVLHRLRPEAGWNQWVVAARRAVRESGLPERKEPGFWDNHGQCCGTAGVGEMALDAYSDTQDPDWLAWAVELAENLLGHAIVDEQGTRWSNTEHTATSPVLTPAVGWSQGAAGIASFLLRLARTCEQGSSAPTVRLPDAL